jgi:hypothetical protein
MVVVSSKVVTAWATAVKTPGRSSNPCWGQSNTTNSALCRAKLAVSTDWCSVWTTSSVEGGIGWPCKGLLLGWSHRCSVGEGVWRRASFGMVKTKCKSLFLREGGFPSFLQGLLLLPGVLMAVVHVVITSLLTTTTAHFLFARSGLPTGTLILVASGSSHN